MASSKKLEMIYYNGQPDGIRSIRRHLSTMTTYVIPRPLLSDAKKISGINRPGIYYLINENDENRIAQIYIGQTRNGISRLDDHNRQKDFWNKAIMFLADSKWIDLEEKDDRTLAEMIEQIKTEAANISAAISELEKLIGEVEE